VLHTIKLLCFVLLHLSDFRRTNSVRLYEFRFGWAKFGLETVNKLILNDLTRLDEMWYR